MQNQEREAAPLLLHRKPLLEALETEFIIPHPDPICQEKK